MQVRVRLAGEAMCDNLSGYTHGALQSGREAAAAYLFEAGKGPHPKHRDEFSLCNWSPVPDDRDRVSSGLLVSV